MSHIVFNIANTKSAIRAKHPSLRILGVNVTFDEANIIADKNPNETRIWKLSDENVQYWRVLSNKNLGLNYDSINTILTDEYESIPKRFDEWISFRNEETKTTMEAAQNFLKRSCTTVRAANLIERLKEWSCKDSRDSTALSASAVSASGESQVSEQPKKVEAISRNDELRGQSWAIIAIIGDANYEIKKYTIMNEIGSLYFQEIHNLLLKNMDSEEMKDEISKLDPKNPSDEDKIENLFYNLNLNISDDFMKFVSLKNAEIEKLDKEPMIAIFDVSEDPELLVKRSEKLTSVPTLKHADIAVVRMYSWLQIDASSSAKVPRTCRDPAGASFFKKMQESKIY